MFGYLSKDSNGQTCAASHKFKSSQSHDFDFSYSKKLWEQFNNIDRCPWIDNFVKRIMESNLSKDVHGRLLKLRR